MICSSEFLFFYAVFPLAAVFSAGFRYIRSFLLLCFPPGIILAWAYFTGNTDTALRSLRWICAIASGTYFAVELGTQGIAGVLRSTGSFPYAEKLSDLMLMAGDTASNAKQKLAEEQSIAFVSRILLTATDSVENSRSVQSEIEQPGLLPVSIAVMSWLFLLVSVSGIALQV